MANRVRIIAPDSANRGLCATVQARGYDDSGNEYVMVLFDDDPRPCRFAAECVEAVADE